jgi:hypothetical protein
MNMPNQERTFVVDERTYTVRFTQNALYRLQKQLNRPLQEITGLASVVEIQTMLWAGLEGARLKHLDRKEPFTIDEVGDIIDELGGMGAAAEIVSDALRIAVVGNANSGDGNGKDGVSNEHPTISTEDP